MGVHGLWKLLESSGKPVPLETLESKVLVIDVSIWLHQAIKGFQDSKGEALPNAHLLGIYHRVCKLLYYKIKPVFVFDGGVPLLKRDTIAKRNQQKSRNQNEANKIQKQLLATLLKHSAVSKVLSEKTKASLPVLKTSPTKNDKDGLFVLPPSQFDEPLSSSDEEYSTSTDSSPTKNWDLNTVDIKSSQFKALPADIKYEILTDLKETRKESSWGRLHELPRQSDDFSVFQMGRLLKRYSIQESLEKVEEEMGGHSLSLGELESLLNDHGVVTEGGRRIASDENKKFIYIKDVKNAIEKAKLEELAKEELAKLEEEVKMIEEKTKNDENEKILMENISDDENLETDQEYRRDLEQAIQISLQETPSTSKANELNKTYLKDLHDSDFDSSDDEVLAKSAKTNFSAATSYMMEYSGLTPLGIDLIINENGKKSDKFKKPKIKTMIPIQEEPPVHSSSSESPIIKPIMESENSSTEKTSQIIQVEDKAVPVDETRSETSDSSEDFLEVTEIEEKKDTSLDQKKIEIIFDVKDELEDDLFGDIFGNDTKTENITKSSESTKTILKPEDITKCLEESNENYLKKDLSATINPEKLIESKEIQEKTKEKDENTIQVIKEISKVLGKNINDKNTELTADDLKELGSNFQQERQELVEERSRKERLAGNITDQMHIEAQELLQLFGIPYVVAPMEAEAQCAFLNEIGLTDGTITDDSDIWLFGGKVVYKNFFDQTKNVLEYRSERIQHYFKLTRNELILLALLVGSDYTIGLQGVGPITAMEILAAFPVTKNELNFTYPQLTTGLKEFKTWFRNGCRPAPGRSSLRNKLKNVEFSETFPSINVIRAYLEPQVETSEEQFTWGKPDVESLIEYAKTKFGWTPKKSEEILKPVVKRMEEDKAQKSIRDYFKTTHKLDVSVDLTDKMSKRLKKAVRKINNEKDDLSNSEDEKKKSKKPTKRKTKVGKNGDEDEDVKLLKKVKKDSIKKVKEIEDSAKKMLASTEKRGSKRGIPLVESQGGSQPKKLRPVIPKKETFPQREMFKSEVLRNKLQAIESFRTSKQGPGYVKKRGKVSRKPKDDAELSESSSD